MALPDTIWQGGQMTDLPLYDLDLAGDELLEIVAPGNAELGLNYRITAAQLAAAISKLQAAAFVIESGATIGLPFGVPIMPSRFLVAKTVPSPTFINFQFSSVLYPAPMLIRDIAGDADVNPITISFFGGELADGLSTVTIATPYGGFWLNPLPADYGAGYYIGTA